MEETIYEKNLSALLGVNPSLAANLFSVSANAKFSVYQGQELIDINIIENDSHRYLYDAPIADLEKSVQDAEAEYSRYPVLFYYGIGNGIFYKLISANPAHKHIIIIEPEIELLYIALNFIDIAEDIQSERIILQLSSHMTFGEGIRLVYKGDIKPYVKLYNLQIHAPFYDHYQRDIQEMNNLLIRSFKQMVLNHGNDTNDALIGIEQHIYNLPTMIENYKVVELIKQNKNKNAVIISTGPSLAKQLPLLKAYAPYMTLVCIDASLPILQEHGIIPDIVVSMERVELTSKFFENLDPAVKENTYFVVSSLTHRKSVTNLTGCKLALAMRPLSYMRFFEMPEFGYIGSGMSAANLGYQLAYYMQHQNILLIGQDLAYADDGRSHSKGHIFSENEVQHRQNDLIVTRYGGEGFIKTTIIWDMFRNFFEKDIEATSNEGISTYNCTEGGARIHGSIEKPFSDVLRDTVGMDTPKIPIHIDRTPPEEIPTLLKHAYDKTQEMVDYGLEFKLEVETLFLDIVEEIEILEEHNKNNSLEKINYENLILLSEKIDVIKEKVESLEFSKMFIDTVQSYIFHQELDLAKIVVQNAESELEKKAKLIEWIIAHRYWLFSLAGGIEAELTAITRGRPPLIEICHHMKLI
ncbi:6-hydroxymethylpterin diphosphokinase MptE-like protein [Sulfuricurvum sp.]|uniref:motility associated factor glycosyltransferase family protein n=1 Tax=Sulfuricurvum sp. TaxID=2025608 RepID=UPI002639DB47|nr:6-hydroxymethylpterin diphosphokinase MptE-like protein [Sulfuricurvum sp.]MDD2265666.1 DUF115 domain-containing protein [Sulfuricurvum sp.]MDD2783603.1 DUF115 domain-containing protein [Sulfuricurvum sp.]